MYVIIKILKYLYSLVFHYHQVTASKEKQFSDAFTIQPVEDMYVKNFYFVDGNVPLILNLHHYVSDIQHTIWTNLLHCV